MRHAAIIMVGAAVVAAAVSGPLRAQGAPGSQPSRSATYTLEEAISLAEQNNPEHLTIVDRRGVASWNRRSAYGAFLPNINAAFGSQYREGLQQLIAGQRFGAASNQISSSYDIGVQAQYNATTIMAPKLESANLRAADAAIVSSTQRLRTLVTQQYLNVLQQRARAAMQDTLLVAARAQLTLAQARADAGAVTPLDVRRAEVAVGQQEVALVQASNQAEIEMLRLFQQMGISRPSSAELTSTFGMSDTVPSLERLLDLGRRANPTLAEMKSRASAAQLGLRSAQSLYTPTLSLSTGFGGYTNQYTDNGFVLGQSTNTKQQECVANAGDDPIRVETCRLLVLTPQETAEALADNRQFPFRFVRNPFSMNALLSIPIFNGFQRELRVEEAAVVRNEARYTERAQALQLETDITAGYLNVVAARRTVALQERNVVAAREAERFASERYRVGLNTFVDVAQSRADRETAENDRIAAVYDYHRAIAVLEAAVGVRIR